MTEQRLQELLAQLQPADQGAMDAAERRQAELAKPPGSLGKLEEMGIRLAGITGQVHNTLDKRRILVLAADNGVFAEGVASTPQSVTLSQAINMTRHLTGMSTLAKFYGDEVVVTDVGICVDCPSPLVRNRKIRYGTANLRREPAMTWQECLDAIGVGLELAEEAARDGVQAVGVGEMGIANTTTSAAVLAALTGNSAEAVTGRGAGLTDEAFARKKAVIDDAQALHQPDPADVVDVLQKVGGLDLAAMTGVFLGCALHRIPAVVDGFISIVAALCAVRLNPLVQQVLFLSHVSYEVGYRIAQQELGLSACLELGMRLGEGSGCPLAFQILRGACAIMNDMATFAEAAINDDYLEQLRGGDAFTVNP